MAINGLLATPASAAELKTVEVHNQANHYHADITVYMKAAPSRAFAIFNTPDLLSQINPLVVRALKMTQAEDGSYRLLTEIRFCVAGFCKTLHQVQTMRAMPDHSGGDLTADVIPDVSDFSYGHADWRFQADGDGCLLHFRIDVEPKFWIPPMIGPWLLQRALKNEALHTSEGIERLAQEAGKS